MEVQDDFLNIIDQISSVGSPLAPLFSEENFDYLGPIELFNNNNQDYHNYISMIADPKNQQNAQKTFTCAICCIFHTDNQHDLENHILGCSEAGLVFDTINLDDEDSSEDS